MNKRRLAAIERIAARSMTLSEFADFLRQVFVAAETTCDSVTSAKFKEEVLKGVAAQLPIERETLEAMI